MREFVISTESNSDMSEGFLKENQILVIPHYYTVEDEEFGGDGKNLSIHEFYDEMRAKKKVGTMASNPAVIYDKFSEIARAGRDILFISFSSALSGGYTNIVNGANQVMEEHPDMKIRVIDSLNVSLCEGILLQAAVEWRAAGKSLDETAAYIQALVPHLCVHLVVDDLDYLFRGGRLTRSSALMGSLVNIKPILTVDDEGKLVALEKVRGRKKAVRKLVENMKKWMGSYQDKQVFVGIAHGDCEEEAKQLAAVITAETGISNIRIEPIGPSIGAHTGPGTIGILFLGEHR